MQKKININGFDFIYNNNRVTIKDSWEVLDREYIVYLLYKFIENTGYPTRRGVKSWANEWRTHSILYKFGLFKEHTADCDLEENESIFRRIIYRIIGG